MKKTNSTQRKFWKSEIIWAGVVGLVVALIVLLFFSCGILHAEDCEICLPVDEAGDLIMHKELSDSFRGINQLQSESIVELESQKQNLKDMNAKANDSLDKAKKALKQSEEVTKLKDEECKAEIERVKPTLARNAKLVGAGVGIGAFLTLIALILL